MASPSPFLVRSAATAAAQLIRHALLPKSSISTLSVGLPLYGERQRGEDDAINTSALTIALHSRPTVMPSGAAVARNFFASHFTGLVASFSGDVTFLVAHDAAGRLEDKGVCEWPEDAVANESIPVDLPRLALAPLCENSIWKISTLKRRRKKMNKHKLRKRKKKMRLKTRK